MLMSCSILTAQIDYESYGSEPFIEPEKEGPFTIKLTGNAVLKAKINKWYLDNEHVEYRDIDVDVASVIYYDHRLTEGALVAVGYMNTRLVWPQNPFFNEHMFQTVTFSATGFTHRFCGWRWIGQVDINFDPNYFSLSPYTYYNAILWGRYTYTDNINVHGGILIQTGMKIDRVFPIFGFDWTINDNWVLNLVFPVNISVDYIISKEWSVSLAGRFIDQRHRVSKDEPLSRGLWKYKTAGVELGVDYEYNSWIKANVHAGEAFGTRLTISNRQNKHKRHFNLESAPYFGGEVAVNF